MPAPFPVDVHIWFQDTESLDDEALVEAGQVLSQEERIQRDRFRFHEDQRDYAVAHSLLRQSLSNYRSGGHPSGWHFEKDAFGKPYIVGRDGEPPAMEFSLSHTRGLVACAISSARVGIDVERVRQNFDYEDLAQSNFSHQEIKALEQLPPAARSTRVLELWTLKEAFLKAIGRGFSVGLDSMWFELLPSGAIRFHSTSDVDTGSWKFALFTRHPKAWMAVAVECQSLPRLLLQGRAVPEVQNTGEIPWMLRWESVTDA